MKKKVYTIDDMFHAFKHGREFVITDEPKDNPEDKELTFGDWMAKHFPTQLEEGGWLI